MIYCTNLMACRGLSVREFGWRLIRSARFIFRGWFHTSGRKPGWVPVVDDYRIPVSGCRPWIGQTHKRPLQQASTYG